MFENISKKQEKVQEKVQKQQELNDKDCRELTDEELDQIVGGMKAAQLMTGDYVLTVTSGAKAVDAVQLMTGATVPHWGPED